MQTRARLIDTDIPDRPVGVVLVLHGGGSRGGEMRVSPTQLSVLRMIPIAERVAHIGKGRLAVLRLLNSVRGWDSRHTPVLDVQWALSELRERFGAALPTSLVGHSLGGRAALLAAGAPEVLSCVALAPFVYPSDGVPLPGRKVLFVHGSRDRIAKYSTAVGVAEKLSRTADVGFVTVQGGSHSMLRHHRTFDGLAADFAAVTLGVAEPTGVIARVLGGEHTIEV